MIELAAPGYLVAGAALALVPLILHMLARTPPERRALPTARFLTADRRTRLRMRRPSDLLLLALRMAFLVLLGAAFARPEWLPERSGESVVVLLDAGADMAPVWEDALTATRERLGGRGTLVTFDTAAHVHDDPAVVLDSLRQTGPGAAHASYLAALRGARAAARSLPAESAAAVLVTRPRWGAWSPGVVIAREAAWRGRIDVVTLEPSDGDAAAVGDADGGGGADGAGVVDGAVDEVLPRSAAIVGADGHPLHPYATAALQALGYAPGADSAADLVVLLPGSGDRATGPGVAPASSVVVLGGPTRPGAAGSSEAAAAWSEAGAESAAAPRSRGRLVLPGGHHLEGWVPRAGVAADGARIVAVWEDGRPAAAARDQSGSCIAYLAAEPVAPTVAADPGFPRLLRALAEGCESGEIAASPVDGLRLDEGALTILRGDALPAWADLLAAEPPPGRPLGLPLAALAMLVALVEAGFAYGRREGA